LRYAVTGTGVSVRQLVEEFIMSRTLTAAIAVTLISLAPGLAEARQKTVGGEWTLTIESLPLHLALTQKREAVTGTMDYRTGPRSR
jgi:hypothetical protein